VAVCYLAESAPEILNSAIKAIGFRTRIVPDANAIGERMAADASAVAGDVDTVVLSPAGASQLAIAAELRARGCTVEMAGFLPAVGEQALRLLGRECVFVP
jgi:hypothetical protein